MQNITIFHAPGMFGSFIEYTIKNANSALDASVILPDGSMHGFKKDYHVGKQEVFDKKPKEVQVLSIVYPWSDMNLKQIISLDNSLQNRKTILIHANNLTDRELNVLFHYYKCAVGVDMNYGLQLYKDPREAENVKRWNADYKTLADMQYWEYREWFSLYYPQWTAEWQSSQFVNNLPSCLKFSNSDFIANIPRCMTSIMEYCNIEYNMTILHQWCNHYLDAQKYILSKFDLLQQICDAVNNRGDFSWDQLTIIEEAIIQQRLRSTGYEIECDGLNKFPTSAKDLRKIMYQIK